EFGYDRGEPIDRFYIDEFFAEYGSDISGRVLEVGERRYTVRFGGDRVQQSDILSPVPGDADATIIADLTNAPDIPDDTFDCVVLTQVLNVVYDIGAVVATAHRIVKPGGVVLATVPGITKAHQDYEWPFCWGFTGESARRLFEDVFGEGQVEVSLYGNVLSATAFLYGLSSHELTESELRHLDPNFQVTIGIRALKAGQ
ncbi:MAG: class I SAM-dependent methyltransferase, partial [Rhizobiaceae bacterium]